MLGVGRIVTIDLNDSNLSVSCKMTSAPIGEWECNFSALFHAKKDRPANPPTDRPTNRREIEFPIT